MERHGRIGWKQAAANTYLICTFLRSLENTVRQALGGRRTPMPSFERLYGLPEDRTAAAARGFEAFEAMAEDAP